MSDLDLSEYSEMIVELEEKRGEYSENSLEKGLLDQGYRLLEKIVGGQSTQSVSGARNFNRLYRIKETFEQEFGDQLDESINSALDYDRIVERAEAELENETSILDYNNIREGLNESGTTASSEFEDAYMEVVINGANSEDLDSARDFIDTMLRESLVSELSHDGEFTANTIKHNIESWGERGKPQKFDEVYPMIAGTSLFIEALSEELTETINQKMREIDYGDGEPGSGPEPGPDDDDSDDPDLLSRLEAIEDALDSYAERREELDLHTEHSDEFEDAQEILRDNGY